MRSLEEDRSLLKEYRDTDTAVDPRAGVGAQVERARLTTLSSLIRSPVRAQQNVLLVITAMLAPKAHVMIVV